MSFGATVENGAIECGLRTGRTAFAQPANLLCPHDLRVVPDIFRFNTKAAATGNRHYSCQKQPPGERNRPTHFGTHKQRLSEGDRAVVQVITVSYDYFPTYRKNSHKIRRNTFLGGMLLWPGPPDDPIPNPGFATNVASYHSLSLKPVAGRLRAAGKARRVVITAVARKRVTIATALCKSRQKLSSWAV